MGESIEVLAAEWLARERAASARANQGNSEADARDASEAYDQAIRAAAPEDLLLAWRAAVKVQDNEEIGSVGWLEARSVSELLRTEYEAARSAG